MVFTLDKIGMLSSYSLMSATCWCIINPICFTAKSYIMRFKQITLMADKLDKSIELRETLIKMTITRRIKTEAREVMFLNNRERQTETELVFYDEGTKGQWEGFALCIETKFGC